MPVKIKNVLVWGSDIEQNTILQAARASRLPVAQGRDGVSSVVTVSTGNLSAVCGGSAGRSVVTMSTETVVKHDP